MCGRYTLTRQERIVEEFEAQLGMSAQGEWWKPRFNVAPTQPAPVVTLRDGVRVVELMRWGLQPFWATKGITKPPLMINARMETLNNKQFFRDALAQKRCLVPADGFFEWRRENKKPLPMYFKPDSGRLFAFAGLWARNRSDAGVETLSFTIITGPPNELVKPIHDRMPLVLDPRAYEAWLDPAVGAAEARALLTTPPVGDWHVEPVSPHVNSAQHDDVGCIAPLTPLPVQGDLFG